MVYIVRSQVFGCDGVLEVYRTEQEAFARAYALHADYDNYGGEWDECWTSDGYEIWHTDEDEDVIFIRVVPVDL